MSRLTNIISLFYTMTEDDTAALQAQLLDARKRAWTTALADMARLHGCTGAPAAPRLQDLTELVAMSREDAQSISTTYNREMTAQIERLYADNPRGNRFYYAARMEAWSRERTAWKAPQIAVTTDTQTTEYARRRFREMNYDGRERYVFSGAAPTCRACTRLFGAGIVDAAFIRANPTPVHPGCPHTWQTVQPKQLDCGELWIG